MNKEKQTKALEKRINALTTATDLDELVKHGSEAYIAANSGSMADTLSLAVAVAEIKKALTEEIMTPLMSLQGSAIGFKTDKKYPEEIVKEATVEALIKGVPMAGNCVNIIAQRAYITKEGFTYLIGKLQKDGMVSNFRFNLHPPTTQGQRTLVHGHATWTQNGEEHSLDCDLPIKTNSASTDDNTLGKAERKLKARCYEQMTGLALSDGDASDGVMRTARDVTEHTGKEPDLSGFSPADDEPAEAEEPQVTNEKQDVSRLKEEIFALRRKHAAEFVKICGKLEIDPGKWSESSESDLESLHGELINLEGVE